MSTILRVTSLTVVIVFVFCLDAIQISVKLHLIISNRLIEWGREGEFSGPLRLGYFSISTRGHERGEEY